MSDDYKIILRGVLQFLFGALLSVAAFRFYVWSGRHPLAVESWIEVAQEAVLFLSALLFAAAARRAPDRRGGLVLVSGFLFSMLIREFDGMFDLIVHGFWKYVLMVFLCGVARQVAAAGRATVVPGLAHFIASRSFVFMLTGCVIVLVYSRLFGMKGLWEFFSSACTGWEHAKTFSEESTELLGYAFMFISGISYLCELAAEKRQRPD